MDGYLVKLLSLLATLVPSDMRPSRSVPSGSIPAVCSQLEEQKTQRLSSGKPIREIDKNVVNFIESTNPRGDPFQDKSTSLSTHGDVVTALCQVLSPDLPQIIAVADIHLDVEEKYVGKTTLSVFVQDLLPALAPAGYHDVVLERLPSDFQGIPAGDPKIFDYLNELALDSPFRFKELKELKEILDQCQKYDLIVYGGGPSIREEDEAYHELDTSHDFRHFIETMGNKTWDHSYSVTERLAGQGKKILYFAGERHVTPFLDVFDYPESREDISIADELVSKGYSYIAVSPILPSFLSFLASRSTSFTDWAVIQYFYRRGFIPPKGYLNLLDVRSGRGRMTYLIFPFEP